MPKSRDLFRVCRVRLLSQNSYWNFSVINAHIFIKIILIRHQMYIDIRDIRRRRRAHRRPAFTLPAVYLIIKYMKYICDNIIKTRSPPWELKPSFWLSLCFVAVATVLLGLLLIIIIYIMHGIVRTNLRPNLKFVSWKIDQNGCKSCIRSQHAYILSSILDNVRF